MCTISPRPTDVGGGTRCVQYTKKKPVLSTSSSLNMAVRGGLTRFARPGAARSLRSRSVQLAVASCRPRSGLLIPPVCAIHEKKARTLYELFFKYGGEGGIDSLRSPSGSPLTAFTVCPTGCRQLSNPVGASHPPGVCNIRKKSPYFVRAFF